MRTITLIAHSRPAYTANVIGALAEALLKPDAALFDLLIFSIDPGNKNVVDVCESSAEMLAKSGIIECSLYVNTEKFGIAGNTFLALQRAFEEHGSDFNMSLEDDAVVTPDAVILADWFHQVHGDPFSKYAMMSLCNHRDFGRGENPGGIPNDPSYLAEAMYISSPFAWCTTRHQWPFIKSTWNHKQCVPSGWDWSLSHAMRLKRMRSLHPILSRCKNIGCYGGVNETPQTFMRTQTNLVYSDGEYLGRYDVVARVDEQDLSRLDDWMISEHERMFSK